MERTIRTISCSLAAIGFALTLACGGGGGGGSTPQGKGINYVDPTTGDYRLVQDAKNSTSTHLVLNLVGPANVGLSGTGFFLSADAKKVSWATVNGSQRISSDFFADPRLVKSKVTGDELQAGVYQKGEAVAPVTAADSVLATIALDLVTNAPAGTVAFSAPTGKAVIVNTPGSTTPTTPITIAVGTLTVN